MIPIKRGKCKTYVEVPEELEYGKYHMKITFKDPRIKMIFAQRKKPHNKDDDDQNWYMHYDIITLRKYGAQFGVQMEMINDGYPNAYIYNKSDLICGYDAFGEWFETLIKLNTLYPDNKLIKKMMSEAYGGMTKKGTYTISMDEYMKRDDIGDDKAYVMVGFVALNDDNEGVEIRRNEAVPYVNNIRLQYLASFTRFVIARDIMENNLFNHVIRVYNDNITLDKYVKISDNYKDETKTTGLIYWYRSDHFLNVSEMKYPMSKEDKNKFDLLNNFFQRETENIKKQAELVNSLKL